MTGLKSSKSGSDSPPVVLKGGVVMGPDNRWTPKSVVLANGKIRSVTSDLSVPTKSRVLDVTGRWVLPGLIDAHVHLGLAQGTGVEATPERQRTAAVENARRCLSAGITSVRDLGSSTTVNIDLARDVDARRVNGPAVVAAGQPITSVGGHLWQIGYEAEDRSGMRAGVKEQIENGARCIKLAVSADALEPEDSASPSQFSQHEIEAAVEEAHQAGLKVTVHAHGSIAIRDSLRAGVDSIEHATFLDEWSLQFLAEEKRWIVPTLAVYLHLAQSDDVPSEIRRRSQKVLERKLPLLRDAIQLGVRIGVGSDAATHFPHGALVDEMEALLRVGLTRESVLAAATSGNADLLGIAKQAGTLEPGKKADLLVTNIDPRIGFDGLRRPLMVIREGELFEPPKPEPVRWEHWVGSTARSQP